MRMAFIAGLAAMSCTMWSGHSLADVKVNVRTTSYSIVGRTGSDLLAQMDRKGPKHGFLTRAIAQTRYTVNWNISWKSDGRGCRVDKVQARLDITYSYPRAVSAMAPSLRKKWNAFLRGVRKHEETHGTLARRMVDTAEASVAAVKASRDPRCRSAKAEVKRIISAAYSKYEAEQLAFDAREHRDDGNVARLIDRLTR